MLRQSAQLQRPKNSPRKPNQRSQRQRAENSLIKNLNSKPGVRSIHRSESRPQNRSHKHLSIINLMCKFKSIFVKSSTFLLKTCFANQKNQYNYPNFSANHKPIGPNQIRIKDDVILASHMEQTKNEAAKASAKFDQMNKNANEITKGLDDTMKQIDEDEKSPVSKIQMDMNFDLSQPRMRSLYNRIGRWQVSKNKICTLYENF
jgi:hypothetical protein